MRSAVLHNQRCGRLCRVFAIGEDTRALRTNHAEGVYIIKPQENARWRVMRYSPKGADDIHDCVMMIYQACGLDKKILVPKNEDFLAGALGFEPR